MKQTGVRLTLVVRDMGESVSWQREGCSKNLLWITKLDKVIHQRRKYERFKAGTLQVCLLANLAHSLYY